MSWDYRQWRERILGSELPLQPKMLALVLNEHMPSAFPGVELMARRCSMSRSSVLRAIATLEEAGWLVVKRRNGSGSHYRLVGTVDQCHTETGVRGEPVSEGHRTSVTQTPHQCQADTAPVSHRHPKQDLKQDLKQEREAEAHPREVEPVQRMSRFVPEDWEPKAKHHGELAAVGLNLAETVHAFKNTEFNRYYSDWDRRFSKFIPEQRAKVEIEKARSSARTGSVSPFARQDGSGPRADLGTRGHERFEPDTDSRRMAESSGVDWRKLAEQFRRSSKFAKLSTPEQQHAFRRKVEALSSKGFQGVGR